MDEVVKNAHILVDILCMARSDAVQGWDDDNYDKAFKWAQYFEQVHTKLQSKPGLANKLDRYLKNFNKTKSAYLGSLHMSFSQLAHLKSILRTSLLQNPYLNTQQFANVLKLYGTKVGTQNETKDVEILQRDLKDLMIQKGTLKILSQMRIKLNKDSEQTDAEKVALYVCTPDAVAIQATSELLFKYALHILNISGDGDQCIHDKLDVISALDDGIQIIISCLLYLPDDCVSPVKASMVQTSIVTWLLDSIKRNSPDHPIWTLPVQFLSTLAYKYQDILTMYLDQLTSWANNMIPVLTFQLRNEERSELPQGEVYIWRSAEGFDTKDEPVTFETLLSHFLHLLHGPIHVQELCNKRIKNNYIVNENDYAKSTKQGTANQLGVNIWKDFCRALKLPVDMM